MKRHKPLKRIDQQGPNHRASEAACKVLFDAGGEGKRAWQQTSATNRRRSNAQRQVEQWKAQAAEHKRRPSFTHLPPEELVDLARDTKRLSIAELEALDEAWFERFGELLILSDSGTVDRPPEPKAPTQPEPTGDPALNTREVLRMTGLSLSTLKRRVLGKTFPEPRRPSQRRINWPYSDVKRWLDELDAIRRKRG